MEEKEKNKILIGSIILVIALILVVVGTTYAFFALEIKESETSTSIRLTTGNANQIVLDGGIEGFHIRVNASDMTYEKVGEEYYATDGDEDYVKTKEQGTKTIGNITINGNLVDKYTCNATVNIETNGTMQDYLQTGDLILVLVQGETEQEIDLTEINNPTIEFELQGTSSQTIDAYLKLTNRNAEQKDIAGKTLNVTINIQNLKCEINLGTPPLEMLKEYATGGEGAVTFTEEDVDGMYRYKGTATQVTNNYICFGTDDTETCTGTPETYMYRIIGITDKEDNTINLPVNSLKIIKATPSSESQQWNSKYTSDIKWDDSDIKTYLNGTTENGNSSGFLQTIIDGTNGTYWNSIILSHSWYNADYTSVPATEPTSSHTTESKIGLMYATDYKNAGSQNTNDWLFIKNGWSTNSSLSGNALYEWTLSRYGLYGGDYCAWYVFSSGHLYNNSLTYTNAVRPVFYLQSEVNLTGEGTAENPFIIHS